MKICFIQYNLGATSETFLTRHINLLKKQFDVYCITGKIHDFSILESSHVFDYTKINILNSIFNRLLNRFKNRTFLYSNSISKGINKIKPDLIVFQFAFIPVEYFQQVSKIDCPFVVIHHGTDLNKARVDKAYAEKLKLVWSKASSVVFISKFLYNEALKLGLDKTKADVIYLGVPIIDEPQKIIKNKIFHVLSVGRLVPVKNHSFLIEGFKIFNEKYPNTRLTIIGEGSEKENIKKLINELGISNSVFLTGALGFSEVENYFNNADLFCLLSKKVVLDDTYQEEGLGLTFLEASLRKLPLIGSKSGGIPEVVSHMENGLLVDTKNKRDLFDAIEYVYLNENKAAIMGERARQLVVERFDQEIQIGKFKALYLKSLSVF